MSRKMGLEYMYLKVSIIILNSCLSVTYALLSDIDSCDNNVIREDGSGRSCSNYCNCYVTSNDKWYNTDFWGGVWNVAWEENAVALCSNIYKDNDFLVLQSEPEQPEINGASIETAACIRNQNDFCKKPVVVELKNIDGLIKYRFPFLNTDDIQGKTIFLCSQRSFFNSCNGSSLKYNTEMVTENIYQATMDGYGWYNTFHEGDKYSFPSLTDVEIVSEACSNSDTHFLLQEPQPSQVGETPIPVILCKVVRSSKQSGRDDISNCHYTIYFRRCNGRLQFETHWQFYLTMQSKVCLVVSNSVRVVPEITFNSHFVSGDSNTIIINTPFLQFRCLFEMMESATYEVNWYINDILQNETGSLQSSARLVIKTEMELGFEIRCAVRNTSETDSRELLSSKFFAGWKLSDRSLELIKGGSSTVYVAQTVPIGCTYTDGESLYCKRKLSFLEPSYVPSKCSGNIQIENADDRTKDYYEVQTLKMGERWEGIKRYTFILSTIDSNYDDKTLFDVQLRVTDTQDISFHRDVAEESKVLGTLRIYIQEAERHQNKICYSHVDPHMRTSDGRYYEQQDEGDFMLAQNLADQMEIQESARYCNRSDKSSPVCACGVAIRFGADAFMINRCGSFDFLDFVRCGDGGLLDIRRLHDYRYMVRTPTGTLIDVNLHSWRKTMNIDIYMSPRDFGHVNGLCGHFNGDKSNDFLKRDGHSSNDNGNHIFSNSWRRVSDSMTRDEVEVLCNTSVMGSPAVREIPDKLADENLTEVLSQCVYDVIQGGDTVWAKAHVQALNNIAATMIDLNPVYAENNTEIVKSFFIQTCLNNCSGHGTCSDTGQCSCTEPYDGPDCGIDLRIPPIILDIEGGGVCDITDGDDCRCFVIRTDNIFDGFMCDIRTFTVFLNGTSAQEDGQQLPGDYEDIFTGVCCISEGRKRRSADVTVPSVTRHGISISNDGRNYGESTSVYVYDTTCIQPRVINGDMVVELKESHCYIESVCFNQGTTMLNTNECYVCNPFSDTFSWTKDDCENDSLLLSLGAIIGITIGCSTGVFLSSLTIRLIFKKRLHKHRSVQDSTSQNKSYCEPDTTL